MMRLSMLAAACAAMLATAGGLHAQPVRLGVVAPLTGGGAAWGIAAAEGARIAAAEVNREGGLTVGGKRRPVSVVAYDDQFKASDTVAAYSRLHGEGIDVMMIQTSNGAMALKQSIEDDNVIALTGGYGGKVVDESNKRLFRFYSGPRDFLPALVGWMRDNLKGRRIVQINPNIEGGYEQAELAGRLYRENGFQVLGSEMAELTLKDYQPMLTRLMAMDPDIIDLGGSAPATTGLMVRQARELGYKGQFIKTGGPGANEIVAAAGKEAAEGLICLLYADPANPGYQRIAAEYRKAVGQDPNEMLLPAYDGVRVLLRAIELAGRADDGAKIAAAFSQALPMDSVQGDRLTLGGKANYGSNQEIVTVNLIGTIRDGKPVVVGKAQ